MVTSEQLLDEAKSQVSDFGKIYVSDGFARGCSGDEVIAGLGVLPTSVVDLDCEDAKIEERFKKANEITDELSEEQKEALDKELAASAAAKQFVETFSQQNEKVPIAQVITSLSEEKGRSMAQAHFQPKIVLLSHEKRFQTDTPAANLSLRHRFLYISVYQLIREHVRKNSPLAQKLMAGRNPGRQVVLDYTMKDEFEETEFSAALFELPAVLEMVKQRIDEVRRDER